MKNATMICLATAAATLISSCSSSVDYSKRNNQFSKEYNALQLKRKVNIEKVYTLDDCLDSAAKNNLEIYALKLEQSVNDAQVRASVLGTLPKMSLSYGFTNRDNTNGSTSEGVSDGLQSLRASTSQDKSIGTFRFDTAISVLDMGLAMINVEYEKDNKRLNYLKLRKATRDLRMSVIEKYFAVAAAQFVLKETAEQIKRNEAALSQIEKLRKDNHISLFTLLTFKRNFLETRKQLREYERSYKNLALNLTSLCGLDPSTEIRVYTALFEQDGFGHYKFPFNTPHVTEIEAVALQMREEIIEADIKKHIAELKEDQEFLKLFPNAKLFVSYNKTSNSFQFNNNWWEAGINASIDLLSLPANIERLDSHKQEQVVAKYRAFATAASIIAQVRIADSNLNEVRDRLIFREDIYELSSQELKLTKEATEAGNKEKLEIIEKETNKVISHIQRTASFANYYVAYYRLLNSSGSSHIPIEELHKERFAHDSNNKVNTDLNFHKLVKEKGRIQLPFQKGATK